MCIPTRLPHYCFEGPGRKGPGGLLQACRKHRGMGDTAAEAAASDAAGLVPRAGEQPAGRPSSPPRPGQIVNEQPQKPCCPAMAQGSETPGQLVPGTEGRRAGSCVHRRPTSLCAWAGGWGRYLTRSQALIHSALQASGRALQFRQPGRPLHSCSGPDSLFPLLTAKALSFSLLTSN